ncbi:kinase-like protein [Sistotremastrum niveocremeum HHB9708]|uniref:non-specific serine/threonine protein kinase n=1 Tax=Sistotremastrum niveocremeum HHB9708 TaxID=1314777 RepID=A0A164P8R7_9AGAM|nr:kinase-like protein [Sistotremastrum niveocremeum HHB9708]
MQRVRTLPKSLLSHAYDYLNYALTSQLTRFIVQEPPKLTESKQDTLFPPNLKLVLDNRYKLIDKLGNGAFGQVYRADDTKHSKLVAVKLEPYNAEYASLRYEIDVYRTLRRGMGGKAFPVGIPEMIWGGSHEGIYRALVLPLLGSSLTSLFRAQKHQLSLGTTLMLVQQMIDRLEWIHDQRIIHRDIKPDNFVMGTGKNSRTLYLIDFGLSKVYRNEEWMHIPYRDGRGFVGNMRYASVNVHLGVEPARRDDLEAVFYVLLDFLTGDLPWRRFENPPESNMIYVTKLTSIQALNFSMGAYYEPEFYQCLWYIRSLRFDQRPDYNYLRATLSALAERKGVGLGECFDWER